MAPLLSCLPSQKLMHRRGHLSSPWAPASHDCRLCLLSTSGTPAAPVPCWPGLGLPCPSHCHHLPGRKSSSCQLSRLRVPSELLVVSLKLSSAHVALLSLSCLRINHKGFTWQTGPAANRPASHVDSGPTGRSGPALQPRGGPGCCPDTARRGRAGSCCSLFLERFPPLPPGPAPLPSPGPSATSSKAFPRSFSWSKSLSEVQSLPISALSGQVSNC